MGSRTNIQVIVEIIGRANKFIVTAVGDKVKRTMRDDQGREIAKVTVKKKRRVR